MYFPSALVPEREIWMWYVYETGSVVVYVVVTLPFLAPETTLAPDLEGDPAWVLSQHVPGGDVSIQDSMEAE